MGINKEKKNIIDIFWKYDGVFTEDQFYEELKPYKVVDGRAVRCAYLSFPPVGFFYGSASNQTNQQTHLYNLFEMTKEGLVSKDGDKYILEDKSLYSLIDKSPKEAYVYGG